MRKKRKFALRPKTGFLHIYENRIRKYTKKVVSEVPIVTL